MTWDKVSAQQLVLRVVVLFEDRVRQDQGLQWLMGTKDCILLGMENSVRDVCLVII